MDPLHEAARAVANAKLEAFSIQARKLATLVGQGVLKKNDTIDRLIEIASANGLEFAHGEARVDTIIADAFADCEFHPMRTERVA